MVIKYCFAGPEVIYFHGTEDKTIPYVGGPGNQNFKHHCKENTYEYMYFYNLLALN